MYAKKLAGFGDRRQQNHRCPFHFPSPEKGDPLFVGAQEKVETEGHDNIGEITLEDIKQHSLKMPSNSDNMGERNQQHHTNDDD